MCACERVCVCIYVCVSDSCTCVCFVRDPIAPGRIESVIYNPSGSAVL